MSVVCVKVADIRPQYQNLKEWCEDPNNVYIGRRGVVFVDKLRYPPQNSPWANPYKISKEISREKCIILYRAHLEELLTDNETLDEFKSLKGKTLGCWCRPDACHGDVILEMLEQY
ncbi:Domain of unknown function (DUF4326)-containing protein [uncultured virus]|nr:Domain of unknown function (DUF4326)-containing protein [uncultured virus]